MGGSAKCPICKEWKLLTEHHAKELGRNPSGEWEKIMICEECHIQHEKYVNLLKARYNYDPDK